MTVKNNKKMEIIIISGKFSYLLYGYEILLNLNIFESIINFPYFPLLEE